MDIQLLKDLIRDERGNYYTAIHKEDGKLSLVNAAVERSYRELLEFTEDFKRQYAGYEHQFIGKIGMDRLRHDIVFAMKKDGDGRLLDLQSVEANYAVTFVDAIEFYRHPREAEGVSG